MIENCKVNDCHKRELQGEIERLCRQPSNEVIEAAVRAMAHVNENATGLKFSDLLRRMAVAAIGVYRSSNEQYAPVKGEPDGAR